MPRPNHDIPNMLLGAIKDYADQHGLADEEAHALLLRVGLVAVGVLPAGSLPDDLDLDPDNLNS